MSETERRKIQLIAGTTYTISLPKEWVKKNNLKEKDEIPIYKKDDGTLVISSSYIKGKKLNQISINAEEYISNIEQILFSLYYMGIETIHLYSKKDFTKSAKTRIRKTLRNMSATEISYEDQKEIKIKVLLDMSRVDLIQSLYRVSLIIDSTISNINEGINMEEIMMNEEEIDRIYHLVSKIIYLSLKDSNILNTSKIKNISLVPSFFLLAKRMENIADVLYQLAVYLSKKKKGINSKSDILEFFNSPVAACIRHLMSEDKNVFEKSSSETIKSVSSDIANIKDSTINAYFEDMLRYLKDIEEETVNISFYNSLLSNGQI